MNLSHLMKETTHKNVQAIGFSWSGGWNCGRSPLLGSRGREKDLPEGGKRERWGANNADAGGSYAVHTQVKIVQVYISDVCTLRQVIPQKSNN